MNVSDIEVICLKQIDDNRYFAIDLQGNLFILFAKDLNDKSISLLKAKGLILDSKYSNVKYVYQLKEVKEIATLDEFNLHNKDTITSEAVVGNTQAAKDITQYMNYAERENKDYNVYNYLLNMLTISSAHIDKESRKDYIYDYLKLLGVDIKYITNYFRGVV